MKDELRTKLYVVLDCVLSPFQGCGGGRPTGVGVYSRQITVIYHRADIARTTCLAENTNRQTTAVRVKWHEVTAFIYAM